MNVTVFLIASIPVMYSYLGKRRNEYRNFSGGPLEKKNIWETKKEMELVL